MSITFTKVDAIIREVAAAEIMPRFRSLQAGDIEMKGYDDPVTVADQAAEVALAARLQDAFPGSVVVGEESYAADKSIFALFAQDRDVWVIDPIDGTRNFVGGNPEFAVMVGLVRRGQTLAGWIYDPNSGDMLKSERGGGVWLGSDKMRLAGADPAIPKLAIVGSRFEKIIASNDFSSIFNPLPDYVGGSATSFDYGRLFTGPAVFGKSMAARATALLYRKSWPWDHVPGTLMVEETGGYIATEDGNPYDMADGRKGLMVTPDTQTWHQYAGCFREALSKLGSHR